MLCAEKHKLKMTMTAPFLRLILFILLVAFTHTAVAVEAIRIGTLQFGTVNWELDTAQHYDLDAEEGIRIEVSQYANKQAAHIIFQSEEADMIVTDWVWVSRKRADGEHFSFIPFSAASGAIMLPPDSDVKTLSDLRGLRLGIAGGAHDKSWLMLQAWSRKKYDLDLSDSVDLSYAAPPLLNGLIARDNLDAVLNFWHYCARLEAQGYRTLLKVSDIISDLDIRPLPMVGYTFREDWAKRHDGLIVRFNTAMRKARELLLKDDNAWDRLRPLMRAEDEATFIALRDSYRRGIPKHWGTNEQESATQLMKILFEIGGREAVGSSDRLMPGTFWPEVRF